MGCSRVSKVFLGVYSRCSTPRFACLVSSGLSGDLCLPLLKAFSGICSGLLKRIPGADMLGLANSCPDKLGSFEV